MIQFLYIQSLVKFLKDYFTIKCLRNQSDFKTGDSCINHLLAITHEIYKSFDACLNVRAAFLDISKAFDKVLHQGLHYKLKQNGISGNLLETLTDFLKD